jgi:hypothetical protein
MLKGISWKNGSELRKWQANAVSWKMRGFLAAKDFSSDLEILELGGLGSRMERILNAYVGTPLEDLMNLDHPSSRHLLGMLRTASRMTCYADRKCEQIKLMVSIYTQERSLHLVVSFSDAGVPLQVAILETTVKK